MTKLPFTDLEKQLKEWDAHFNHSKLAPKLLVILPPFMSAPLSQLIQSLLK